VLGVHVAVEGLWGAWNVLAKATLGLAATVLLVSTTTPGDLLRGLDRLRVPPVFTAIAGFMLRYVEVIGGELRRMRVARISRAHDPRWIWQARAVAATAGTLFVRSFERGERVHLAMVSRGFDGTLRRQPGPPARPAEWALALAVVAVAAAACVAASVAG
jgi:cobalt/nickel transport system permease protein